MSKYNLADIEPIAPAPDADDEANERDDVRRGRAGVIDQVGLTATAALGAAPAVGVSAEREDEGSPPATDDHDRRDVR